MTPALIAVVVFMLVQFGIGVWVSRRIRTEDDYLLAGRRLGYPLATFSIFATWFGAETVVGAAGVTYADGVSLSSAEPFGYGLCLVLMGIVYAAPLWRRKLVTLADLFRQRFSVSVERLAAVVLIPTSILWAAAQIRAFGQVLSAASPLHVNTSIAIAAALTIAYTVVGGLMVDAITDLIQGIILTVGLIVVGIVVFVQVGGMDGAAAAIAESGKVQLIGAGGASFLETLEAWAIPICGSVIATELVARVIATRTPTVARRASVGAGAMYLAIGSIPVFVGLVGAPLATDLGHPEQLLPSIAQTLLPTVLYAVFAGGLLSAILSTVDSTLLVASGLLSHNLVVPAFPRATERMKVLSARLGVMTFGIIAYVLAIHATGVFELVEQASALGSAGTLVAVTFGLFTRWGGARTAAATIVAGMVGYVGAAAAQLAYPFLLSLVASLTTYGIGCLAEGRVPVVASAARTEE